MPVHKKSERHTVLKAKDMALSEGLVLFKETATFFIRLINKTHLWKCIACGAWGIDLRHLVEPSVVVGLKEEQKSDREFHRDLEKKTIRPEENP